MSLSFLRFSNFQDFLVIAFMVEAILHANEPFIEERDL
jgi:hypothetical protein